jgi:hypothetical protein
MPSDERLSRLLSTLEQVALSVELQPTLQILLDSDDIRRGNQQAPPRA